LGRGDSTLLAQRRYEVVRPVSARPRKRRRVGFLRALIRNRMACVLLLALAASFILSVYVGAYARATETGYHRGELLAQLKSLRLENERFRLQLEELRQPDRIAEFALASGMEQGRAMVYLRPVEQPSIARNLDQ
jgi:cell division protein FtsL